MMMIRTARAAPLLLLVGCTAHWDALVRYSGAPAPAVSSLDAAVFSAVIQEIRPGVTRFAAIMIPEPDTALQRMARDQAPDDEAHVWPQSPRSWDDSLRGAVDSALGAMRGSHSLRTQVDTAAMLEALALQGISTTPRPLRDLLTRDRPPIMIFGRPGYNGDSTIAAIRFEWSEPGFAFANVYVLARRPGEAWRIWWVFPEYIT